MICSKKSGWKTWQKSTFNAVYSDSTASSGEILTYGVQAVWGGEDISERGNAGEGTYAFVIDSGVLDTTGDLLTIKPGQKAG